MQITAIFENIHEMQDFAKMMMGKFESAPSGKEAQAPVSQPTAAQGQVPMQPQVSVQSQAPVTQAPVNSVSPQHQAAAVPTQTVPAAPMNMPPSPGVPTTAVTQNYTQDQLAVAMTGLVDQNKRDLVLQILAAFGAGSLMQVPKERYAELALELRKAGANI